MRSLLVAQICHFLVCWWRGDNDDDHVDNGDEYNVDDDDVDDDDDEEDPKDEEWCLCKPLSVNAEKSFHFYVAPTRVINSK